MRDLININKENGFDVILDIRYATTNNITKEKIYNQPHCLLHFDAAQALKKAILLAKNKNLKFKIFDAFRPIASQELLFNKFPTSGFVSNPKTGSIPHCRGVAIDLTLVDENEKELDMGTDFDNFTELAFHNCNKISKLSQKNRQTLLDIMINSGWDFYSKEWWHYQLFNPRDYPVV